MPGAFPLRLCLDLQLDALLLTLGTAVLAEGRGGGSAAGASSGGSWRSWLEEDLDCAYRLATLLVHNESSLPAMMSPRPRHACAEELFEDIAARYQEMDALLGDCSGPDPQACEWSEVSAAVLDHCRRRLRALSRAARPLPVPGPSMPVPGPSLPVPEPSMPGEWLG